MSCGSLNLNDSYKFLMSHSAFLKSKTVNLIICKVMSVFLDVLMVSCITKLKIRCAYFPDVVTQKTTLIIF